MLDTLSLLALSSLIYSDLHHYEWLKDCIKHILRRHYGVQDPSFDDVKKWYDENLSPETLDFDNQEVYKNIFHKGKWAGVFQFTEKGAQGFCQEQSQRINH